MMSVASTNDEVRSPAVVGAASIVSFTVFAAEPWTALMSTGQFHTELLALLR